MPDSTVSVVMAVFNGGVFLKPTIDSVLNQTFADFEFIIVNDASRDNTRQVVESYRDPRIVLTNNDSNLGQTKSLNIGLQIARGKYIARIDAGDFSCRRRLEKQLKFLQKKPEADVVGTAAFQYEPQGRITGVVVMPETSRDIISGIFKFSPIVHISAMMKRGVVLKAGGYDEDFQILADYKLWSTLLQKGCCLWNMPEVLSGYMVSPESFGYANVSGRSLEEAAEILRSNAAVLAKCSISIAEAADIYRFFTLNMNRMALKQIISTESLFIRLSKRIRTRSSEIRFFLFKQYLKYFLTHIQHPATDIFGHAVRSLAKHGSGLLAKDRMTDSFRQILLSRRWKHRQLSAFSK